MSSDNYPFRMLLAIAITIGGIFVISAILANAPNFFIGMLYLIPIVPLLRLIGDIANPDEHVSLEPWLLLKRYLAVLFLLVMMLGAIAMVVPVMAVGLGILGAALAILVGVVGLLLWSFQYGLGITLARPLAPDEWQPALLALGAGIGVGLAAFGLAYLGTVLKDRYEERFWQLVHRVRDQIDQM